MFVAVWPPPPAVADIDTSVAAPKEKQPAGSSLRWTEPEQWHVTLRFLGEVDPNAAAIAFRSLEQTGARFVAELGPVTGRFGKRVLHVPVNGLEALASATVAATAGVGEAPDDRGFAGHITLARARSRTGADLSRVVGHPISGRWEVAELTLVASRPGRDGVCYDVVEAVRLLG